jgi:dTDP-4-dehydrorhamnose reductase
MSETVVITGGSGLLALNWALAMKSRYSIVLGTHTRDVTLRGVGCRKLDLESQDALERALDDLRPAVVVHAAGMTNVDACESDPAAARHVNIDLAVNVARACSSAAVSLVHVSTDHLFAGTEQKVDEATAVSPVNVYGATKAEAERRVLDVCDAIVVRTNFYGWGPSYRPSFSDLILRSLRERRPSTLFDDVYYTPICVEVLANAVHGLVDRKARGVFNLVGDERVSKFEFGRLIAARFGLDPTSLVAGSIADNKTLVRRPREMSLSNDKACKVLGRRLGGVDQHLDMLIRQEQSDDVREVQAL